jgi:hypothetical protein
MPHFSTIYLAAKDTRRKVREIAPRLIIISLILLLNSCVIPLTRPGEEKPPAKKSAEPLGVIMRRYEDSPVCCRSFKEFVYDKLGAREVKSFNIDENSKASTFHSGKSWFASFELPEYSGPYSISIKSYIIGDNLKDGYAFSPQIIFLNKDFNITKTIIGGLFEYIGDEPGKPLSPGARLEAMLNISHEQRDFRYMIILTPGKTLNTRQEYSPTKTALAAVTGRKVPILHSPAGRLRIDLTRDGD